VSYDVTNIDKKSAVGTRCSLVDLLMLFHDETHYRLFSGKKESTYAEAGHITTATQVIKRPLLIFLIFNFICAIFSIYFPFSFILFMICYFLQ